jgi:ferric-dicitrate binding protein FerR (iron transport regulator)
MNMKGTENRPGDQADLLEDLFRNVSSRERPSRADEQAVRKAIHAQWAQMTRRRKIRRAAIAFASAASVVLAVIVGLNLTQSPELPGPAIELAVIEKKTGTVESTLATANISQPLASDSVIGTGQSITTGSDSRLGVRWISGESVRLDQNTDILVHSATEIELLVGQIYLDTDQADSDSGLVIRTPAGAVRHLGTRYLTSVGDSGLSVSVREGRVQLQAAGLNALAEAGEQMNLDSNGVYRRASIPTFGPLWQWTESLAPAFASDGRTMDEFLDWVARESGRELEYRSASAEEMARGTILRGKVDMEPMKALSVVLQTSDLESEINGGSIVVSVR